MALSANLTTKENRHQHLYITVYELQVDTSSDDAKSLSKQHNGPYLVKNLETTEIQMSETTTIDQCSDTHEVTALIDKYKNEGKDIFYIYPLICVDGKGIFDVSVEVEYFIVITGIRMVEEKIVCGEDNVRTIYQDEHDTPETIFEKTYKDTQVVWKPFAAIIPITNRYMVDVSFHHVPETAVTKLDGNACQADPDMLNEEGPTMPLDPTGLHLAK